MRKPPSEFLYFDEFRKCKATGHGKAAAKQGLGMQFKTKALGSSPSTTKK